MHPISTRLYVFTIGYLMRLDKKTSESKTVKLNVLLFLLKIGFCVIKDFVYIINALFIINLIIKFFFYWAPKNTMMAFIHLFCLALMDDNSYKHSIKNTHSFENQSLWNFAVWIWLALTLHNFSPYQLNLHFWTLILVAIPDLIANYIIM